MASRVVRCVSVLVFLVAVTAAQAKWVLGRPGQHCDDTCTTLGGCIEEPEAWTLSELSLRHITARLGHNCKKVVTGESPYDPSASGSYCGWQTWRVSGRSTCAKQPPPATRRFCPCRGQSQFTPTCNTTTPAIGMLALDGYFYPTQPGDIDDFRTWCNVKGADGLDYKCTGYGESDLGVPYFSVVKAWVKGAEWGVIQAGNKSDKLRQGFKDAVLKLLQNENVCAITGHAGFFSFYQSYVSDIITELVSEGAPVVRKPMLLGTPSLTGAFVSPVPGVEFPYWSLLEGPTERVLIVTSNFIRLTRHEVMKVIRAFSPHAAHPSDDLHYHDFIYEAAQMLKNLTGCKILDGQEPATVLEFVEIFQSLRDLGMSDEDAAKLTKRVATTFFSLGWNEMPGYGLPVVHGAMFHNVHQTLNSYEEQMLEAFANVSKMNLTIAGIIMESTEMPAHSNSIRNLTGVPVWDISTLGKCLVKTSLSLDFDTSEPHLTAALYGSRAFKECMLGWYREPRRSEPMFGVQKSTGKLKWYDGHGLSDDQLENLACNGGRPDGANHPIGRLMAEFDTGSTEIPRVVPACQETLKFCLCAGCSSECPGGANCGSPTTACGTRGENATSSACIASTEIDVPTFNRSAQCPAVNAVSNLHARRLRQQVRTSVEEEAKMS